MATDAPAPAGREPAPGPLRRGRRLVGRLVVGAFVVGVCVAIALALRGQDWSTLGQLTRPQTVPALAAALAVTSGGLLCAARAWLLTISATGAPVPGTAGVRMFFVGFLGKFLPGRVWGLLALLKLGERAGVSHSRMAGIYLVNVVVVLLSGGAVSLLVAPVLLGAHALWLFPALGALLGLLLVRPALVDRVVAVAARLARRPQPARLARPEHLRRSIGWQTASWVLFGVHVWLVATLLGAAPVEALPVALGSFAIASVAGTLALFVPDGVGVRDVLLIAALTVVLALPAAVTTAIASRVLCTLAEVLTAGAALLVTALRDRRAARAAATSADTSAERSPAQASF
ncbi:lysylphosphatidylglycerol synthase domain-containing protein [Solwaraspora sp. WMMD937]|uniref:lysylphosphatidylglycerol synthase domain-containing protein n=1 Tax=Solwaraspora sp. WMMD937 TaxID=3016090 RepID=UPI00249AE2A6|nr:lysylphosphatidylglycerol synthase domain-containing protein [Solwaraspora sp. WMMD937]WFE19523.1 lysylphosphatidylglycerol synthase domain-containing protein [Solwaraspora sp. WMMD937]